MKSPIRVISIAAAFSMLIVLSKCAPTTMERTSERQPYMQESSEPYVSDQIFYDDLSPYGQWVEHPEYGYVWLPDVDEDFTPYATNGHWVLTDVGWTWVSEYSWGWAPFHYGRWDLDQQYGWLWVPGEEWAPAWVTWRRSEGYYGWAPIAPGISLSIAFSSEQNYPSDRWIFVHDRDIDRHDVNHYYVNRAENITIIRNTTIINNTRVDNRSRVRYGVGPDRDEVQRVTRKNIRQVELRENNSPGQNLTNDRLSIYKPQVQKNRQHGEKSAPTKVVKLKEARPVRERNGGNRQGGRNEPNNPPGREQRPPEPNMNPTNNRPIEQQRNVPPPQDQRITPPERSKGNEPPAREQKPVSPQNDRDNNRDNNNNRPKGMRNVTPPEDKSQAPQQRRVTPPEPVLDPNPNRDKGKEPPNPELKPIPPAVNSNNNRQRGMRNSTPPEIRKFDRQTKEPVPPVNNGGLQQPPRQNPVRPPEDNTMYRNQRGINRNDTSYQNSRQVKTQNTNPSNIKSIEQQQRNSIQRNKNNVRQQSGKPQRDSLKPRMKE